MTDLDSPNTTGRNRRALDKAAGVIKTHASDVQTRAQDLAEEARAYADRTAGQLSALSRSAVERAREKPAVSALAILGVGVAIGAALALTLRQPAGKLAASAIDEATRLRGRLRR